MNHYMRPDGYLVVNRGKGSPRRVHVEIAERALGKPLPPGVPQ